jgi:hypothetical protein
VSRSVQATVVARAPSMGCIDWFVHPWLQVFARDNLATVTLLRQAGSSSTRTQVARQKRFPAKLRPFKVLISVLLSVSITPMLQLSRSRTRLEAGTPCVVAIRILGYTATLLSLYAIKVQYSRSRSRRSFLQRFQRYMCELLPSAVRLAVQSPR